MRLSTFIAISAIIGVFCMLISLGFWQLGRAEEKQRITETFQIAQASSPFTLTQETIASLPEKLYHNVKLSGYYDNSHQLIYDNQTDQGSAGYYVLTPFILERSNNQAVLVNRGFIAWGYERNIADVSIEGNARQIVAQVSPLKKRFELGNGALSDDYPLVVQSLDLPKLSDKTGLSLLPVIALLSAGETDGYTRNWQPFYGSADKHFGYAVQWFAMAFMLCVLSFFLWRRKHLR